MVWQAARRYLYKERKFYFLFPFSYIFAVERGSVGHFMAIYKEMKNLINNMLFKWKYSAVFLISVFLCSCAGRQVRYEYPQRYTENIRVAVAIDKTSVKIKVTGKTKIVDDSKSAVVLEGDKESFKVTCNDVVISFGEIEVDSKQFKIFSENPVEVENIKYRGDIIVKRSGKNTITVINELPMEQYLYGVVPCELSACSPVEALKAQAVAARTFAFFQKVKKKQDFDVDNTINFQVYRGINAERLVSSKAVDLTAGEILYYNDNIATTPFHANCGGQTADAQSVWGGDVAYLKSVSCPYCSWSNNHSWEGRVSEDAMKAILIQEGCNVSDVKNIIITNRDCSGRVSEAKIYTTQGVVICNGKQIRALIGGSLFKSTKFSVYRNGKHFEFKGKGWGHGVGMCQDGACGMAKNGNNYKNILRRYYQGTEVVKLVKAEN